MSIVFDYHRFYTDLNRTRANRKIAWNKVATRAGVVTSGLHTFVRQFEEPADSGKAVKGMSLETMVKLLHWMGKTDIATYMISEDAIDAE